MSNIEVEIKGKLLNQEWDSFVKWLNTNTLMKTEETHKEIYLDRPVISFFSDIGNGELDGTDFLRIRQSDTLTVCLKKWLADSSGELTHCEEFTIVANDFEETLSLFEGLGFLPKVSIFKKRKIFLFNNFEVVLDDVYDLGIFFEVEWKGESTNPDYALDEIRKFLISTGITGYYRLKRGYVSMFLNPDVVYEVYEKL
jgi:predicted adenylyl cyclase CyaB